jgi:YVTN family beta-propeller protein
LTVYFRDCIFLAKHPARFSQTHGKESFMNLARRLVCWLPVVLTLQAAAAAQPAAPEIKIIATIPAADGYWDYASFDAAARRVYVGREDGVMSIDVDTNKVTPQLLKGERVHSIVPLPGGLALSTNGLSNHATLFEQSTGNVLAQIPTGKKPDAALFDAASKLVLVMDGDDNDTTLIDPATRKSVGHIALGGSPESATADGQGRVFVNLSDQSAIAVIDVAARKVIARYKLPGCEDASGLGMDPKTNTLVATCANMKAIAVDAKDGRVLASLPIGKYPDALVFDPGRRLFFVPCASPGTLVVIAERAGAAPEVIANIPVAMGAHTVALDAQHGRLYLPAGEFRMPTTAGGRPTVVPGTVKVQVLSVTP